MPLEPIVQSDGVTPLPIESVGGGLTEDLGSFINFGADTGIVLVASFTPGSTVDPSSEPRMMIQIQLQGPVMNGPPQIQDLIVSSFIGRMDVRGQSKLLPSLIRQCSRCLRRGRDSVAMWEKV